MSKGYMCEEERDTQYDRARHESADDSSSDESCDDHWIWSRRDKDLFDRLLELRHVER